MAQGREEFDRQLRELGFSPQTAQPDPRVVFTYTIPRGRFTGQVVTLGLEVPPEFPRTPPPGPHLTPRILPMNPGAASHPEKTADSPFGGDWQYLSRPFTGWKGREGVATYLELEKRRYDQVPTLSNWHTPDNIARTVEFCRQHVAPERLKGFLLAPWRPTLFETRERHMAAIEHFGKAIAAHRAAR